MTSVLLFIFMLVTSLMFLGMLWGDRLSLSGLFEVNWLGPIGGLLDAIWRLCSEFLDFTVEFVVAHFSWVIAAVSGAAGLILVAFLMGGGLASDAEAYHLDSIAPLYAGGVVDRIRPVKPAEPARDISNGIRLAKADIDDSQHVFQAKGGNYVLFGRPEYQAPRIRPRRPIEGSIASAPTSRPLLQRPELDVRFNRLYSATVVPERVRMVRTDGRLIDDLPSALFVDRAVRNLLRDDWRTGIGLPIGLNERPDVGNLVAESPLAVVRDLESRIRVTPGVMVSRQDLRIEKTAPQRSATGEVTMQVSITNLANDSIDGLLVRELLPYGTKIRGTVPQGVLREATLTWLVSNLRPQQERVLRFTVIPADDPIGGRDTLFESLTEVSALTAVMTRTVVTEEDLPPTPSRPSVINRPPLTARAPRLRLQISKPRSTPTVGSWTTLIFRISNIGNANAENVQLRLILDEVLDHHALSNDDLSRRVDASLPQIAPGESRDFDLVVKPTRTGLAESSAELLFEGQQLYLQSFSISTSAPATPSPVRTPPTTSRFRP
ncbi:MAG TPA: CARDB domain-containing protein [Planctomycetaceae bacterium]|nr:CARDB domain-containing protein [Planctomycetaceae bacterium]HQZ66370.1 CARDB domain-containing protein [Planctomycetaceae bacterium]